MRSGSPLIFGLAVLLVSGLLGCALSGPSGRVLFQQGRTVVQLETDPTVGGTSGQGWNTHPIVIKPQQMATLLRGVRVRSEPGVVGALLGLAVPAEAVFTDEEVSLLAPVLAEGLAQAGPAERVGFTLRSAQSGRRYGPLSGHLSVRDPYLKFGLNEHPTVGWEDPEDPPAPKLFELEFIREGFLRPASEEERKGTYRRRPVLQIDYRRYLATLTEPGSPTPKQAAPAVPPPGDDPASSASAAEAPRAGPPAGSQVVKSVELKVQALTEELARLREELAETKQLLADKVLELNRLKSKSGGSGKSKSQPAPSR
jgi:hypothetical protein